MGNIDYIQLQKRFSSNKETRLLENSMFHINTFLYASSYFVLKVLFQLNSPVHGLHK